MGPERGQAEGWVWGQVSKIQRVESGTFEHEQVTTCVYARTLREDQSEKILERGKLINSYRTPRIYPLIGLYLGLAVRGRLLEWRIVWLHHSNS